MSYFAYERTTAAGSSALVNIPFPYLATDHVHVYVDGVETAQSSLVWTSSSSITLPATPTSGAQLETKRITPNVTPLVDFSAGALSPTSLNDATLSSLYVLQEGLDIISDALGLANGRLAPVLTARDLRILNVGAPSDADDAATKAYVDAARILTSVSNEVVVQAKFDGTDESAALVAAYNMAAPIGTIIIPAGKTLCIGSTFEIGDGTTTSISTACAMRIRGAAGGGVGPGEFGSPQFGSRIKWVGATDTSAVVVKLNGPIHSLSLEDLLIDCDAKAGYGVVAVHPYQCEFRRCVASGYTTRGWHVKTTGAPVFSGITQGAMQNLFSMCEAVSPGSATAIGATFEGDSVNNVGCSRNITLGGRWEGGGGTGSGGLELIFCDNNQWFGGMILNTNGLPAIIGTADGIFPGENTFYGTDVLGGVEQSPADAAGTGGLLFFPYPIQDGEPPPNPGYHIRALGTDGVFYGGISGSLVFLSGNTDNGTALGTTQCHFPIAGNARDGATSPSENNSVVPVNCVAAKLYVHIDTAPGGSAARSFTLYKNGVATALTVAYGAAMVGGQQITATAPGLAIAAGDLLYLLSDVSGTPANSNAYWSLAVYPQENPL